MSEGNVDLGYVLLALNNGALKFNVTAIDKSDSIDEPLNLNPIWYTFTVQDKSKHSEIKHGFTLKVSKNFTTVHDRAIRAGLAMYSENPDKREHVLTTEVYDELEARLELTRRELRQEILRKIFSINRQWPNEPITNYDVGDNIFADEKEISVWLEDLRMEGSLITGGSKINKRQGSHISGYCINPQEFMRIEKELASELTKADAKKPNVRPLIFLSYKHDDRILAGKIKSELESRGMDVFLAHEDIDPSGKWLEEILVHLEKCDVFMPLLTNNFRASVWTDQEAGNAIAMNKLIMSLKFKDNPHGFLKDYQALPFREEKIADSCEHITNTIIDKLGITPANQRHSAGNQ